MKKVSIIIPFCNENLSQLLEYFQSKFTYDKFQGVSIDIIWVQNERTYTPIDFSIFSNHINNYHIIESEYLNSPYSARNRGIEFSNADWFVFLDANCLPNHDWVEKLIELDDCGSIYAANIQFFSIAEEKTVGDLYDSIVNIDNEKTIHEAKVAKTACLALPREVIDKVGHFEEGVRSGGDVIWTKKCTDFGFKIEFVPDWIVHKASRSSKELIIKQFRVSQGWPNVWYQSQSYVKNFIKRVILCWLPPNPTRLFNIAARRGIHLTNYHKVKLIAFGTILRIVSALGIIIGTLKIKNKLL
ncbi:glycosyltransferase [Vibrio diazotrophicus]|uniref:glycosyltransferase n=1 Tax=Vibrio diazotrophicus TaxID=685 RepID=UPI00142DD70A|nr:glycosyltransferase [Vibrio diazotrophicus]NIY94307.1 glycosyltransferase family 2 protein [Vibrio diazotrophicus]